MRISDLSCLSVAVYNGIKKAVRLPLNQVVYQMWDTIKVAVIDHMLVSKKPWEEVREGWVERE